MLVEAFTLAALASPFEPNYRADANLHVARLRRDLLSSPTFDRHVAPTSDRNASATAGTRAYSASGTDVQLQVRFFKVMEVKAAAGSMRLKVWLRTSWTDDRLAWDPAEYGGITETFFNGESIYNSEVTEIWLPDLV